jgi:hypothetical protein
MDTKKVIGKLDEKTAKESFTDIKVGGVNIRVWNTIKRGQDTITNPALEALNGCRIGEKVEAVYFEKLFNGRAYANLLSIAIQSDDVPDTPPVSAPSRSFTPKAYGKSPEERMSILVQSANHDATALMVPWIAANVAADPEWFVANYESGVLMKAHANIAAAIVESSVDAMGKKE